MTHRDVRIVLILAGTLVHAPGLSAQRAPIELGGIAGLNASGMSGVYTEDRIGAHAGLYVRLPLTRAFAVRSELALAWKDVGSSTVPVCGGPPRATPARPK